MDNQKSLMLPESGAIRAVDPRSFPDLDNAKVGISVDPKYKEFRDGESLRCIFCGLTLIKNGELVAAVLQAKDGFYLNSGVTLVNQLRNLQPGTAVQVTYMGKRTVKDGAEGARANVFQVNVLEVGPVETQSVTVPSSPPPPTPAATAPAPKAKAPLYSRPLDPWKLRELMIVKMARLMEKKNLIVTQADRGIVATKLKTTFEGDDEKRHLVQMFLVGKLKIKEMNQVQVKALLDWLECPNFDSVPPAYVVEEAREVYKVALEASKVVDGVVSDGNGNAESDV